MPNKYLDRLTDLIESYQTQEFLQFRGPTGAQARWDDYLWHHICPTTGFKTRFLAGKHNVRGCGCAGEGEHLKLRPPYDGLVKVWIVQASNAPISPDERQARVSTARKLLTHMAGDLYVQTAETVTALVDGVRSVDRIKPFLDFCANNGLMPTIHVRSTDVRDRTGHGTFDRRKEKLPDLDNVLLLGALHREIFQSVNQSGMVASGATISMMEAIATTFGLLGLASPNRLAAEVPVLAKQRLKKYSEGGREPVHYLDWPGSKGYSDNRNHILAVVADEVERAVNFFFNECEPARALCRFYEDPRLNLGELLEGSVEWKNRVQHLRLDKPPPNLFVLGYALGFYPENACVPVFQRGIEVSNDVAHNGPKYRGYFAEKPVHALENDDLLSCSTSDRVKISSIPYLFGYAALVGESITALGLDEKDLITVSELQERWINYFKKELIPTFPISFSTGEGNIRLADALFCIHGPLMYRSRNERGSGGKALAKAFYSVSPLHTIGLKATYLLSSNSKKTKSLFEIHGHAGVRLLPHSLRHLGNTLAELSEIPREVITAWSGRTDPEQTETYLHNKHDEQSRRIRAVMNPTEHDKRAIRVVAQESIAKATNLPASITSAGICTQELHLDPCDYLNDFVSQCFMCSAACHIAGDTSAIELFEKDKRVQLARLTQVRLDQRLSNSLAMQKWFVIHSRNTHVLACLIDLMKTLLPGSVIRYSPKSSEFHITDAGAKATRIATCLIPNFDVELRELLEQHSVGERPNTNPALHSLLSSFDLTDETA
ncbi:hypothetical protein [Burkholderia cenocepacia]|uniref:hypothetical protein n=1 Tax=Burkholderia cenocepacia TaxID=95486 RepID=UPI00264CCE21|nr:hypothetical protein [Burkholderia cenocepacia]MDN7631398.1 hypothetical protein [Burkholderia cenocepacia]